MRSITRWLVTVLYLGLVLTVGGRQLCAEQGALGVASAAPEGVLTGSDSQRIQIVFDAAIVPLGEVKPMDRPPTWLTVTPPILARWRWAGTAELIGEPLAPLPRATQYTVKVAKDVRSVDGKALAEEYTFTFTTPKPQVSIHRLSAVDAEAADEVLRRRSEYGWDDHAAPSDAFAIYLVWNQPIDAGSLVERLRVRVDPRPLEGAEGVLAPDSVEKLRISDPKAFEGWQRFLTRAKGTSAGEAVFTLEPDPKRPNEVFVVRPVGCWPLAATIAVKVLSGVRAFEGVETNEATKHHWFETPMPLAPLRFAGRAGANDAFDPEDVKLVWSNPVAWRDVAGAVTVRAVGDEKWRVVKPFPSEWRWTNESTEMALEPLGIEGGREYELCVAAGVTDVFGRELEFPWCGRFRAGHRSPSFYLVEGDGVVESEGPHLLPLRSLNVTSFRAQHAVVTENDLVATIERHEASGAEPDTSGLSTGDAVPITVKPDRTALVPIDLDRALGGKPGIVLTRLDPLDVVPESFYNEREAEYIHRPRWCVTQVTALGVTVKASGHEGALVWITHLKDTKPVTGAQVTVRDKDNAVLWQGTTDGQGLARASSETSLEKAFVVTARVGDDLAYARMKWYEGHRGWEFNLPVDYNKVVPMGGSVWPDRGVVRPGESVHLKTVVRAQPDRRLQVPAEKNVTFVVRSARGDDVLVRPATLDAWGGAEIELAVPKSAGLGNWEVLVGGAYDEKAKRFADEHAWTVRGGLLVAEFRRPKFRVRAQAEKDNLIAGDPVAVKVEGSLLAGGAMAQAPAKWSVRASRSSWRPEASRWNGWDFMPWEENEEWEREELKTVAEGEGKLDASGSFTVRLAHAETIKGWPTKLDVEGEVTDVDRQSSAATARVDVMPGEFFVGIQRPPFFVEAKKGIDTALVALRRDGSQATGAAVTVELVRRHWESVRRREVSGRYVFESREVTTKVSEQTVTTATNPAPVHFAVTEGGEYTLIAKAKDARGNEVQSGTAFYVFGEGFTPWRFDQENRIDLVTERDRYAPGDTARILVKSPWERTTALVTVERAGVLEARVEELTGTMPMIEVPVRAEHAPNAFVSVVLLRGRVELPPDPEMVDPGRPAYRVGYCELTVPPKGKRLRVNVAAAKQEYRPGQQAQATISVTGEDAAARKASVTVWAVDAGILDLTHYHTPDLMSVFFARRGLGVQTSESRSRLVGRRSYGTKGDKSGGGGGKEGPGADVRRDFRALAVWRGDVVTDEKGQATISFQLPESLTTYRLMAVALSGSDEFGGGESEFRVTKPMGIEPALPRFLRPADKARAGVVVRNRTKIAQAVEVKITLAPDGPVSLRGTPSRIVNVAAGGSAEVGFGFIGQHPGVAKLRFDAATSGASPERDAIEIDLPVVAVAPSETVATFFATETRAQERIAVPDDVFPSSGGLEVRLASSNLVDSLPGLEFLLKYPHGCAEQVSSRLLGITAAVRLGEGFAPKDVEGTPVKTVLERSVSALAACQRSDGGFAFWPDGGASFEVLSAYVAWALVDAQRAGATVEAHVLDDAARYLSQALRKEQWGWGEEDGWTAKVMISFALARLGRPEPAYFQQLFDARAKSKPVWGRALLESAMLAVNAQDQRAKTLARELHNALAIEARAARLQEKEPDWGWYLWWSEARGSAAALLALLAADPKDPIADRVARGLLDHLARDQYRTTHETAWMLQALASYRERREAGAGERTVTAMLGDEKLIKTSFVEQRPRAESVTVSMPELQRRAAKAADRTLPLVVQVDGKGLVHGAAILSYASRRADRPPLAQGLVLGRRFLDRDGEELSGVQAGEEVTVEVTVECPAGRRFVAVEIPIPAGLEALDPKLATTARHAAEGGEPNAEDGDEDVMWRRGFDHVELRDDRIMLYATELSAGRHTQKFLLRATTSGTFVVAPAHAEEMYVPEIFGTTPVASFEVIPTSR